METPAPASSIHKRFVAGFVRRTCGELVHCFGPLKNQTAVRSEWAQIRQRVLQGQCYNAYPKNRLSPTLVQVELRLDVEKGSQDHSQKQSFAVYEAVRMQHQDHFLGIVLSLDHDAQATWGQEIDLFFSTLILSSLHVDTTVDEEVLRSIDHKLVTEAIVDLFDKDLRYVTTNDKWKCGGRQVFQQAVDSFTSRGKKVELCLPAFPCKSSSTGKVLSKAPDRGEYLALVGLHAFIHEIESVYPPGAKLWIISDGHVFSDCIGVDDDVVDQYGAQLQAMNRQIAKVNGSNDRIGFRSLPELFGFVTRDAQDMRIDEHLPELSHYIPTKMTEEAERCRKILTMGFQMDSNELREVLSTQDASMVALYRGFSKFMLEDLTTNKYTSHLSRSQLRKRSAKVAFEMIQRNQAYSNLVQILFPHHVRLSIHAHDSSGPKFGIQMLGKRVIPTDVLPPSGGGVDCCDKLHVPTPWHNCIVEIQGHADLYITKSAVARSALSTGEFTGHLIELPDQGCYIYLKSGRAHLI